jgi:hypothetical protein
MPVQLSDAATGRTLEAITDQQFQALVDALEEESTDDRDYYINVDTVEMLEAEGADPQLVAILRRALDGREDMDLSWQRL